MRFRRLFTPTLAHSLLLLAVLGVVIQRSHRLGLVNSRLDAMEEAILSLSSRSVVAVSPHSPKPVPVPDGAGMGFGDVRRLPAPYGWRYAVANGPIVVLPNGRFLRPGMMCRFGVIEAVLPDCVVTSDVVLEFGNESRRFDDAG